MARELKNKKEKEIIDVDIINDEEDNISKRKKKNSKDKDRVYFVQRLGAFIIDVVLVSLLASLIASPFINLDKNETYNNKLTELSEEYVQGNIDINTYAVQYIDICYKSARNSGALSIIAILLEIIYFVVLQIYLGGQTIGKKLCKIKVVSLDGDLTMNQMIYRSFIANFILADLIAFIFMLSGSKYAYFYGSILFQGAQYIVAIISVFMIFKSGYAVHDKLAHTKVINVN
jgi:uncharacterized RDD family membrane protein YckC